MANCNVNHGVRDRARRIVAALDGGRKLTLNQRVQGSNPCAPTTSIKRLAPLAGFIPSSVRQWNDPATRSDVAASAWPRQSFSGTGRNVGRSAATDFHSFAGP